MLMDFNKQLTETINTTLVESLTVYIGTISGKVYVCYF